MMSLFAKLQYSITMNIDTKTVEKVFPDFEKQLVNDLSASSEIKTFKNGDVIMRTGQNIRFTVLVLSGLIKVYREDQEGNEHFMYYLQPGEACAVSMACGLRQQTSQMQAKAVAETEVIAVPLQQVDDWMTRYKSWDHFVLETYRNRFEELLTTIDHIAFRNMDERLVFYLKKHQQTLNSDFLTISFTEIAQELNSSREVISRLMKKLSEKGLVKLHRNQIEIVDLSKMLT